MLVFIQHFTVNVSVLILLGFYKLSLDKLKDAWQTAVRCRQEENKQTLLETTSLLTQLNSCISFNSSISFSVDGEVH